MNMRQEFTEEQKKLLTPILDYEVDTKGKMSYDNRIWDDKL